MLITLKQMAFSKYRKLKGQSGVSAYEICPDHIKVVFGDMIYVYTHKKPGKKHVTAMKKLARLGMGLSTYISRNVKDNYERKYAL